MKKITITICVALLVIGMMSYTNKVAENSLKNEHRNFKIDTTKKPVQTLPQPPQLYTVKLSIQQWQERINQLDFIKKQFENSDFPYKTTKFIIDSCIVDFSNQIIMQIREQIKNQNPNNKK